MNTKNRAVCFAILAAVLYAVNIPVSKWLLQEVQPTMLAAFLYLGAGVGLFVFGVLTGERKRVVPLTKREWPYILGMILLDIAAPVLLMVGLKQTDAANASLLNNFEIVATSVIALLVFKETLSGSLRIAILLVTVAGIVLSFEGKGSLRFNAGSVFVLGAACCWGLENNCTRMLSDRSSLQITTIKGVFSGLGSLLVALMIGEDFPNLTELGLVAMLGFVSYGLSINFYIQAQKDLGAAKTSAYYAIAPFVGVFFGIVLLGECPGPTFYIGFVIMAVATILLVKDTIALQHSHVHTHVHTHTHSHGALVHTHEHRHTHSHGHTHVLGQDEKVHEHLHEGPEDHDHSHEI